MAKKYVNLICVTLDENPSQYLTSVGLKTGYHVAGYPDNFLFACLVLVLLGEQDGWVEAHTDSPVYFNT